MLTVWVPLVVLASELNYPTPPNPFATKPPPPGGAPDPFATKPPPPGGTPAAGPMGGVPLPPPSSGSGGLLPGSGGHGADGGGLLPGGGGGDDGGGDDGGGLLPGGDGGGLLGDATTTADPPPPPVGGDGVEPTTGATWPAASAAPAKAARPALLRWRPALCLAALSAVCAVSRPREAALVAAIDAHHDAWGELLGAGLRHEPVDILADAGVASVALHSQLLWLGMLGQWLPLLPTTAEAIAPFLAAVGAPQLLVGALTLGYALRKLLPRAAADGLFGVSFSSLLRRGGLHTLLTSSLAPVGLVHWLHAVTVVLVATAGLDAAGLSRASLVGLYVGAGAAAGVAVVLTQLLFGRRQQPRSTVSAAVMGLLLLRATAMPEVPLELGALSLPPLRAVLLHMVLDGASNALPPPAPRGVEKLFAVLGAATLVAALRPQLRDAVLGAVAASANGRDWRSLWAYVRAAL